MKKWIAVLMMILLITGSFAACGGGQSEQQPEKERTVVDMAERTVTLPDEIKSIGTFGSIGVLNAFVELMGEGDKICNEMSPSFTKTDKWKYQYLFAPQLKNSPVFEDESREIQMETVLETSPDLCLAMDMETVNLLEEQGLTVIYLSWYELDDVEKCVTLLGEVFNKQDVAEDYLNYFNDMTEQAKKLTAGLTENEKKTLLYGNITQFTQPHTIAEWWITEAGGISVTNDGRTDEKLVYTMEDILLWDPDVMITASDEKGDIIGNDTLKEVSAVKGGRIFLIPTVAHVWGNRTPEQPLTIMWVMNKLYPELKPYDELASDIKYFYSHFYNYKMSDDEIAQIIDYKL